VFEPTITYNSVSTTRVDENGMPIFVYNAASDYSYGGRGPPLGERRSTGPRPAGD